MSDWLAEAERRAETPMLLVERDWARRRRERLLHRLAGLGERQARPLRAELAAWTTRLLLIERELTARGMP